MTFILYREDLPPEEGKGNQVRTARRLGINRNTLRKKMKDLQIIPRVVAR
ncbi:MAG: hypothetical protein HY882_14385 [Deltaproteobacteria bacterium]|nr:hypothetical protein [Deltaproteobacteria bacterium]